MDVSPCFARFGSAPSTCRADEFDLIAVGRALLSDPAWPKKIRSGQLDTLLPFDKAQFASLV